VPATAFNFVTILSPTFRHPGAACYDFAREMKKVAARKSGADNSAVSRFVCVFIR
jgi:hypothetical protein